VCLIERLLRGRHRELRLLGEVGGHLGDAVVQRVVGDEFADQPLLVGVGRVDALAEHDESPGGLVADQSDESLRAAPAGDDAEVDLRLPDDGPLARDPEVAGERELTAAAERVAVYRRDDGRGKRLDGVHDGVALPAVRLRRLDAHLRHPRDVGPGGERLLAGTRDD
jgi:hypothetical protein